MTKPMATFGAELRRRRFVARLTLDGLADRVHYSKSYLSKIENGQRPPSVDLARRCDAALEAGGELVALVRVRPRARQSPAMDAGEVDAGGRSWLLGLGADGSTEFMLMNRREVMLAGGTALFGVGISARALSAAARDRLTLATFRSYFLQLRQLGQSVSPAVLVPPLVAQTRVLRTVAAGADPPVRGELLLLGARYAEYTGWMAQESGDQRAAGWWTDLSVRMATAAGDRQLAAYAFVRRALVTLYLGDGVRTVELARRAQATADIPARIRGLAAQREAQGHALTGSYDQCRRALDRAGSFIADADPDPAEQPTLGGSTVADPVAMATGWCLHDLGRPAESVEILSREVERIPPTARRARARYGARLALAAAAAGEVDHSCAIAENLLDDAAAVDSATIRVELRDLAKALNRWHTRPSVRELSPRLAEVLQTLPG